MADAALKVLLRVAGLPNAPVLSRRLPASAKSLQAIGDKLTHDPHILGGRIFPHA